MLIRLATAIGVVLVLWIGYLAWRVNQAFENYGGDE